MKDSEATAQTCVAWRARPPCWWGGEGGSPAGPHTITPTGPTISHKQLCGEAEPDDTPSLHLGSLTRTLGELLGELLALPALHL